MSQNNVLSEMKPLLGLVKMLGLCPYVYSDKANDYAVTYWNVVCGLIFQVSFGLLFTFLDTSAISVKASKIHHTTVLVSALLNLAAMVCVAVVTYGRLGAPLRCLRALGRADRTLAELGWWRSGRPADLPGDRPVGRKHASVLLGFVVFMLSCILFELFVRPKQLWKSLLLLFPQIFNVTNKCLYCQWVHLLTTRFRLVNRCLDAFLNDAQLYRALTGNAPILKTKVSMLRTVSGLHMQLCKAFYQLNAAFSFQMLCYILLYFIEMTMMAFVLINYQFTPSNEKLYRLKYTFETGFWFGVVLLECFYIIWATANTCNQAGHVKKILIKYKINKEDGDMRKEVLQFLVQLMDYDLKFSVCGFFDMDLTLINSMIGAITTYLVITVQSIKF